MKANTKQLVSINEIVNEALLDLGESAHVKEQCLHWGVRYYKKYRMDMAREIVSVRLDLTPWKAIILPDDCVDWILVGIPNGEEIMTFTKKSLRLRECGCDESEPTEPDYNNYVDSLGEGVQYYNCNIHGEDPGKLFGLLVKDNDLGYFSPNYNQRVNEIQLSAKVPAGTRPYLMYLSTLFDPKVENVVHPYAQPMIVAGIHYDRLKFKRRAGDRNITRDMIADAKEELDNEICLLAERRWDLSAETIIDAARQGRQLGLKG